MEIMQALGWALLHSLWIGAVCVAATGTALRFISEKQVRTRYLAVMAGFCSLLLFTGVLFLYLLNTEKAPVHNVQGVGASAKNSLTLALDQTTQAVQSASTYMPWLVVCWLAGVIIFFTRVSIAWWYGQQLIKNALPVSDHWLHQLEKLVQRMAITTPVRLVESISVQVPMLIGYLKPVILVPVGMLSGLTPAEVESILIHELVHIKRYDYLINLFQAFVECLLFFNPFVWMISGWIRRERELCCDDGVLHYQGDKLAYAYALTRLEEIRISRTSLAISVAGEKNQLLHRIKRLMNTSMPARGKFFPIVLLLVSLLLVSFISWNRKQPRAINSQTSVLVAAEWADHALVPSKKNSSPDGQSSQEESKPIPVERNQQPSAVRTWPRVAEAAFVPVPTMNIDPAFERLEVLDSIPPLPYDWSVSNWEEFSREFEKSFRERFGDFYKKNEKDMQEMMEKLQQKFGENFESRWEDAFRAQEEALAQLHSKREWKELDQSMKTFEEEMKDWEHNFQPRFEELSKNMRHLDLNMKALEESMEQLRSKMKVFEEKVQQELIQDGYLKAGEKINSMQWDEEGSIKINGITIRKEHLQKYNALKEKYLGEGNFRYVE